MCDSISRGRSHWSTKSSPRPPLRPVLPARRYARRCHSLTRSCPQRPPGEFRRAATRRRRGRRARAVPPLSRQGARSDAGAHAPDAWIAVPHRALDASRLDLLRAGRVGGHHADDELGVYGPAGALGAKRSGDRARESGYRVALPTWETCEDPTGQRAPRVSRHATPDSPARPALSRAGGERRAQHRSGVEGHRAGAGWWGGGYSARYREPRRLDAALSHRRTPLDRNDDAFHSELARRLCT